MREFLDFREAIEQKLGFKFENYEPISYTQQVVAGMVYRIVCKIGNDRYVHARVYKPLSESSEPIQCSFAKISSSSLYEESDEMEESEEEKEIKENVENNKQDNSQDDFIEND
jgi:cystatin-A/B